ncbi:MAG: hypothetical protein OXH57_03300 [Ekhidna sp.]|nr:hypothetical protein [Ekhidna sp.]
MRPSAVVQAKAPFSKQSISYIDWNSLPNEIDIFYRQGKSKKGQSAYPRLLLFKMLLMGIWYDLIGIDVDDMVNESLSAIFFVI